MDPNFTVSKAIADGTIEESEVSKGILELFKQRIRDIMKNRVFVFAFMMMLFSLYSGCSRDQGFDIEETVRARRSGKVLIFDHANILNDASEYCNRYLRSIRDDNHLEALIVTVPTIGDHWTIDGLANKLFENWQIGRDTNGRGILFFLVNDEKQVRLEISAELEDVFTDGFTGYVEDLHLKAAFLGGRIGTGLMGLMEELEKRAQLKDDGGYSQETISKLDMEFLSQGAGARRDLTRYKEEKVLSVGRQYPAGATPEQAWKTMIQAWKNKVRDPNLGVYTRMTRLAYRDYRNLPDSHYEKEVSTYANKPYEVIQNKDHAVIFFGNKKGWDNAPFLLCRTEEGWQFDIVRQRKYIRMGRSPLWGIERTDHPYVDLISRCPYFMGQDIPLEPEDVYKLKDDRRIAERIMALEKDLEAQPDDFDILMELGKLWTITSGSRSRIEILQKATKLNPQAPGPHKYLAISHVDMFYQYRTAIQELNRYMELKPGDPFAYNFLGYLYLEENEYKKAIAALEKAVDLQPDNCYAYCKLSRAHAMIFLGQGKLDPRRNAHVDACRKMLRKAETTLTTNPRRVRWLKRWLKRELGSKLD
ncbi:MAG: TPM domain-containing protein [Deltaproteobacteria bacterium]|nr:TPM domain-containing protein [Deltaproteobacteria bacterium]